MTQAAASTRSVVMERVVPHSPDKVWRALTEAGLIQEWLMKSDFRPEVGHRFEFRADWGSVGGEVLTAEPPQRLAYTWEAMGLKLDRARLSMPAA